MGFTTANLSLYHTFSKTPVDSNTSSAAAQLGNAINKSGHTVQSNEIWTESIPFFGLAATTTAIHNKFSATAKVNDLVKDSDGKIWQRNSTLPQFDASGALTSTFEDLWFEKTTSITSNVKVDGAYPTTDGALVDGSYLLNSEGVPTVKYYEKRLLTRLTADNNANTNSDNKASRLQIDGKWIDQFIGVTDIYLNGSAAVSYAPVLRQSPSASPMQAGPVKGYMDYCATGLILWESSASGTEVIDCFEYVGEKLNSTVASLTKAVFGEDDSESGDASLTQKVAQNTAAISKLNGTGDGSVAKAVADAEGRVKVTTDALAGRIAALEGVKLSVQVVDAVPATPVVNTLYLVPEEGSTTGTYVEYIAYKPEGSETVTTERIGTTAVDLSGYTTDAEHEALQGRVSTAEGQIATITSTDATKEGSIAKALADAKTYAEGQASAAKNGAETTAANALSAARTEITAEIAQAKSEAIASAEVTLTQGTGIIVTPDAEASTSFTIAVSDEVATAASVSALSQVVASNKTELEGKITAAETAASTALETAKTEIKGTTDALDTRLQTAESKVSTLEGQVATLETATVTTLPAAIEQALTDAKAYSDSLHTTSLDYVVLGDSESLPTASAATLGKIYLVKEGNTADGESNIDALSGSYVEYMTRKIGDGESATYAWEKIGTTAADLSAYAKDADVVKSIATANGVSGTVTNNVATITVQDGTTKQKGIVQLDSTISDSETTAATPKAVKEYAQKALTVKDGRETVTENDLWGTTATLDSDGNLTVTHDWVTNPSIG